MTFPSRDWPLRMAEAEDRCPSIAVGVNVGAREITSHKVHGLNEALTVLAIDELGHCGANHDYAITFVDPKCGSERSPISARHGCNCIIAFQKGPVAECGVNGISIEALIAICIDRLRGLQNGPYHCEENGIALRKLESAMEWLHRRTKELASRGVEGAGQE